MIMHVNKRELVFEEVPESMFKYKNLKGQGGSRYIQLEVQESYAIELAKDNWRVKKRGFDPNIGGYVTSDDMDAPLERAQYFVSLQVNYNSPVQTPVIYRLVDGDDSMVLMKPDSKIAARDVGRIDKDIIKEATLVIGGSYNKRDGKITLYLNEATFVVERSYSASAMSKFDGIKKIDDDGELPWDTEE
jgi:hypothetical protein